MRTTRREFVVTLVAQIAAIGTIMATPSRASACLVGTWKVICPNGHVDTVTQVTCQHVCQTCGAQAFSGGDVSVVCPNGHVNRLANTGNRDRSEERRVGKECRSRW